MDNTSIALIIGIALILAIVIGNIYKVNMGVIAIVFTFLIGLLFVNLKLSDIYLLWPIKLFFTLLFITMFFGVASENNTITMIAEKVIMLSKGKGWLIPIVLWVSGFVPCIMGGTAYIVLAFLAPVLLSVGRKVGMKIPFIIITGFTGTMAGSNFITGYGNGVIRGLVANTSFAESANIVGLSFFLQGCFTNILTFIIFYIVYKGYKLKDIENYNAYKVTADKKQKITVGLIIVIFSIVLIPMVMQSISDNTLWEKAQGIFDVTLMCAIGSTIAFILKLADEATIFKQRIPWGTIFMACGFCMIMALATKVGVMNMITSWITTAIAKPLIGPMLACVGGILSFFSGAVSVVCPILFPTVDGIVATTGLPANMLFLSIVIGACQTAISPLSTAGALFLANLNDENKSKMFYMQFALAAVCGAIAILLSFFGFYNLIKI